MGGGAELVGEQGEQETDMVTEDIVEVLQADQAVQEEEEEEEEEME